MLDALDDRRRQACGGVHRHMDGNHVCPRDGDSVERLTAQVDALDVDARTPQPGCGRREAEWLSSKFVGGDQDNAHLGFTPPGAAP